MNQKITEAVKHLIIINVILYIAPKLLTSIDLQSLFALHFPKNPEFGYWQYLTHMFMHSQTMFMHILFNMYALWAFGTPLERIWGRNKFLFFFISAGLGAGIIYTLVNYYQFNNVYNQLIGLGISTNDIQQILNSGTYNDTLITIPKTEMTEFYANYHGQAVGASGAVYGVLVAFGLMYPNAKLALIFFPVPIAAKYFIPLIIASDLFFGITKYSIGNVAHFAHVGGAIIGFIIAFYWKKNSMNHTRWD